jgi:hypothetical protein
LLQVFEDATVITTALRITDAMGVQLGAVDTHLEAQEEEVIAH